MFTAIWNILEEDGLGFNTDPHQEQPSDETGMPTEKGLDI